MNNSLLHHACDARSMTRSVAQSSQLSLLFCPRWGAKSVRLSVCPQAYPKLHEIFSIGTVALTQSSDDSKHTDISDGPSLVAPLARNIGTHLKIESFLAQINHAKQELFETPKML